MSMTPTLKDKELADYFEALFAMYPTEGWRKILEDMGRLHAVYNDLRTCETDTELHFRRGQLDIIDQILTHQARTETGYTHALREQEGGVIEITRDGRAQVVSEFGDGTTSGEGE